MNTGICCFREAPMGIRKKIFIITAAAMLSVMIVSYCIMYLYFYRVIFNDTMVKQRANVELNRRMADNFVQSVFYTAVQIVSDKAMGGYLSYDCSDSLKTIQMKQAVKTQFTHYAALQSVDNSYYYRNTLFLSGSLPIGNKFEKKTLNDSFDAASSNVYSNENVRNEDWYREAVKNFHSAFVNKSTDEFCMARKIVNNYFVGPYTRDGTAVLVVSVARSQLDKVFSSTPVTKGSGYALLNENNETLYYSNSSISPAIYQDAWQASDSGQIKELIINVSGEKYVVINCEARDGLKLLFLTPNSDVLESVWPILDTYTMIFAGIALVLLVVIYILAKGFSRPLIRLSEDIGSIRDTRGFDKTRLCRSKEKEMVILENSFCRLIDNVNQLIDDIELRGEKEKRYQLRALQAQINPHFIFNAMDMVNWLALSRNCDDIANIVDSIAKMMRYSITDADGIVPIAQEITNISEFVFIYQIRHNNRLQLETAIEADDICIPKFTLQPLVENSVRHADVLEGHDLHIQIRAWKEAEKALIEVHDNGTGCDANELNRHLRYEKTDLKVSNGFGIRNVNERIGLWFNGGSGLIYRNPEDKSLTVRIILDMSQKKKMIE